MKIFRNISLLLLGLFLSQVAAAQTVLTGTVKDETTGSVLTGANVYVTNSENRALGGAVADATGQYRLTIPADAGEGLKVTFSFVGYTTQTVDYTSQRTINMVLQPEARIIGGSTVQGTRQQVNAMGITEKESAAASQTITLERLESAPVTNIVEALQGSLAGVDILTGADPGATSTIRMRGVSSFTANAEPLIVLDGVPFPVDLSGDFNFATANSEDFGQLLNISPNDLESITALKDAAATALWGSRGSSGVIEITTKKGQQGRMQVRFSTKYEFKKERSSIPLLNGRQYTSLMQDELWNAMNDLSWGSTNAISLADMLYDTPEINYDPSWVYFDEYNQNTAWADEVTQTGHNTDSNISISGGGEKTTYRLSLGYVTDVGTTIGTDLHRMSLSFNMQYRFSNKFLITTDFSFAQTDKSGNYSGDGVSSARSVAYNKMPNMTPYALDQYGNRTPDYFTPYENFQGNFKTDKRINPVALVHESFDEARENTNRVVFRARYDFIPGLTYEGILGLDIRGNKGRGFLPQSVTGVTWVDPAFNKSFDNTSDSFALNTENRLTWRKNFNEDNLFVPSLNFRTEDQKNSSYNSSVSGNASGGMTDPVVGGKVIDMNSGFSQIRRMTGLANVFYEYKRRYSINATVNMEANSSLGKNSRIGIFPSFSAAWHFGDEKWFDPIREVIHTAKLRLSWGQVGKTPRGSGVYFGKFTALDNGYMNMPAIEPSSVQLNDLKWEIMNQNNLGIDVDFFGGKLQTTTDIYYNKTKDLLQNNVSVPSSTGYSQVAYINAGVVTNKGWEFHLNYDAIRSTDWGLNFDFNISQNQNEVKEMPPYKLLTNYTFGNGNYASKIVLGNPIGSFYGYKYQGIYQNLEDTYMKDANGGVVYDLQGLPVRMSTDVGGSYTMQPGDAKYEDINGDGRIDQYDVVYLGNSNPRTTGGLLIEVSYKNWELTGQFHGRLGHKVINDVRVRNEGMRDKNNQSTKVLQRWRKEGDQTDIPRALYGRGYNYLGSDRFVEDASFLRLKTVSLRYNVPENFLARYKMSQAYIYATVYNLWTITDYTGLDPEINTSNDPYFPLAIDKAMTPQPIRFAAGLSLTF